MELYTNCWEKTVIGDCSNTVVPKISNKENDVPKVSGGEAMLWHQRLGHIGEKGLIVPTTTPALV